MSCHVILALAAELRTTPGAQREAAPPQGRARVRCARGPLCAHGSRGRDAGRPGQYPDPLCRARGLFGHADNLDEVKEYRGTHTLGPGLAQFAPDITPDGRYVVYASPGLGVDDQFEDVGTNAEIYRVDLSTSTIDLISVGVSEDAYAPTVSDYGNTVAFATSVVHGALQGNTFTHTVYVRDLATETTRLVHAEQPTATVRPFQTVGPSISGSGQFVAFQTVSDGFDPRDTNNKADVYLWDRDDSVNPLSLVSVTQSATVGPHASYQPAISAGGTAIAFLSEVNGLVPRFIEINFDPTVEVFVRDVPGNKTRAASATPITNPSATPYGGASNWSSFFLSENSYADQVSADGRRVVYISGGFNLLPPNGRHVHVDLGPRQRRQ